MIIVLILLGYIDLFTDMLTINQLIRDDNIAIAVVNIVFVVLGGALGVVESDRSWKSIFLNLTYTNILMDGVETLRTGKQTPGLVAGKKLDAIVRSMPSIVLQLYALLKGLQDFSPDGLILLFTSIGFGVVGSAATLAGLHSKAGHHLVSKQFLVINVYYLAELVLRSLVIALAFLTVGAYAFIAVGIDLVLRLLMSQLDVSLACLYAGSDNAIDGSDNAGAWFGGSMLTFLEMMVFMIVMFTLPTNAMQDLRDQGTAVGITIFMIVSFVIKTVLWVYIHGTLDEEASHLFLGLKFKGMEPPKEDPDSNSAASSDIVLNVIQHMT
jgi:hypothetical protein